MSSYDIHYFLAMSSLWWQFYILCFGYDSFLFWMWQISLYDFWDMDVIQGVSTIIYLQTSLVLRALFLLWLFMSKCSFLYVLSYLLLWAMCLGSKCKASTQSKWSFFLTNIAQIWQGHEIAVILLLSMYEHGFSYRKAIFLHSFSSCMLACKTCNMKSFYHIGRIIRGILWGCYESAILWGCLRVVSKVDTFM